MRIAVTGREGQIVRALLERARGEAEVIAVGRPDLDLARIETIGPALEVLRPDLIVNAAAHTAVDRAESEPQLAEAVNALGAGVVAAAARHLGVPVIHISTDYVFDGRGTRPYREDDPVAPLGVYGLTKLGGERAVAAAQPDHVILRTSWVHGPHGANFVRTMLRIAATRDEAAVVADQFGCPTSSLDLADAVLSVARRLVDNRDDSSLRGVFHATGAGETSWAGFAEAIFAEAVHLGRPQVRVRPIASADYPTAGRRPPNSRLDCARLRRCYDIALPPWQDGLGACVARILRETDRSGS